MGEIDTFGAQQYALLLGIADPLRDFSEAARSHVFAERAGEPTNCAAG